MKRIQAVILLPGQRKKTRVKKTRDLLSEYNVLSTYSKNLNDVKRYKEKSGSGIIDPQQLFALNKRSRLLNQKNEITPLSKKRVYLINR